MHWRLGDPETMPLHEPELNSSLVNQWSALVHGRRDVFCYKFNEEIWVIHEELGAIKFDHTPHSITAYPPSNQSLVDFVNGVGYVWLPLAFQYWGIQVLHASASAHRGEAIGFVGPTQVGKSTLSFGLARHGEWKQIADDRLAFSTNGSHIALIPIDNRVRLRPASIDFFTPSESEGSTLSWPQSNVNLRAVYFLIPETEIIGSTSVKVLGIATAQKKLLSQAYALATVFPKQNRQTMIGYLELATRVPVFELCYERSFARFEETIDFLENHIQQTTQ